MSTQTKSSVDVAHMKADEPIEVRITRHGTQHYHLVAYRTGNGTVAANLTIGGVGTSHSLSNLQARAPFPGKAVQGWQVEVVAFANSGLGQVVEVR